MKVEQEKRFALLASLVDLGSVAKKHEALDNIHARDYLILTSEDLAVMPSRRESRWRNDLAFVRKHLVMLGYLNGSRFNQWEITSKGRDYFERLCETVLAEHASHWPFQKLTPHVAIRRAAEGLRSDGRCAVAPSPRASLPRTAALS